MNAAAKKLRVLVDLKPALDGYAGIPQESRLLFSTLLENNQYETHGLLQHGGDHLRSELTSDDTHLAPHEKLARLSRTVISFDGATNTVLPQKWSRGFLHYVSLTKLRLSTISGRKVTLGIFDASYFQDFIWSRFFSKTLKPSQKSTVAQATYRILCPSRKSMHKVGLTGGTAPYHLPFPKIDTSDYDYLIAQTPFPGRVSKNTQLIVRYHDAIPIFMPHTISDRKFHQASHYQALKQNVHDGALFACISESTKKDLLTLFPEVEARTTVISNVIAEEYFTQDSKKSAIFNTLLDRAYNANDFLPNLGAINERINTENTENFDYLLMVSTLEPRKNHSLLLAAWERLKQHNFPNLKLVIVGSKGWNFKSTLSSFLPWAKRGELHYIHNVPAAELRQLYHHAAATICPSVAEGFNYSGVEAMRCGSPVVSSDIPVHREVYGKASVYFDAYNAEDTAEKIAEVINLESKTLRENLAKEAQFILPKYSQEQLLPQWEALLQKNTATSGQRSPAAEPLGTKQ